MPINFEGISTTKQREYYLNLIYQINERLRNGNVPMEQRAAILGSIIEESGGNPLVQNKTGAYQGLLQWGADRYRLTSNNRNTEMNNQTQYILNTIDNTTDGVSWTHGGKGSGYKTQKDAHDAFNSNDNTFADKFRAFSYGYVRPQGKGDSYQNRLRVGREVLNKMVVDERLSKLKPKKWTPIPFDKSYVSSFKYDEGGSLDNPNWDNLSISDKAEMMKVAIANGITTLPEIRRTYNEFAKGGRMNASQGYIPSDSIKKRIANWEGSSMRINRSFEDEARDFNRVVPAEVRNRLSQQQKDALYSYGYNVGMGRLKERVVPILTAYTEGNASKEDVQRAMWASRDNELRGLTTRRNAEREMFGGNYRTKFTGTGKLGIHIDPSEYTIPQNFFDGINAGISLPQMQMPNGIDTDPETLYKAPIIDETLFEKPVVPMEEITYNPQEDKMEGIRRLGNVLGMMRDDSVNNSLGILDYVGRIYS